MSRLMFGEKSGVSVFNKGLAYVKALGGAHQRCMPCVAE